MKTTLKLATATLLLASVLSHQAFASVEPGTLTITVDGQSGPWDKSVNPSFPYAHDDPIPQPPASVPVVSGQTILVQNATGAVEGGFGVWVGPDGYVNDPWGPQNDRQNTPGISFPSNYAPSGDYPIWILALMGTFVDANGHLVGTPFKIGTQSLTLAVPAGASNLLFGVNDDVYADNLGSFQVEIRFLTGGIPPTITQGPTSQTVLSGGTATFSVTATGTEPLSYQWRKDGAELPGQTGASLTLNNVQTSEAGNYDVVVSNGNGSVTSQAAQLTIVQSGAPVPLPSGAVAWWRAENNALDEIGGHHGTLKNGVGFTAGEVGQAFSLDGVDDFIRVSATSGLPVDNAPRTVELWFRTGTDFTTSTDSALIQYGTTADTRMFGLLVWSGVHGRLYFYGHNSDLAGTTVLEPNQWYHGAVTYDGTTVTLYLNGEYEGSRAANLDTLIDRNGLTIGYRPESGWRWKGLLDEVTMYNRALTAEEVHAIYRAQSGGKFFTPQPHILLQPESQTVPPGGNATFRVGASGTEPLSYQWRFNGSDLADGGRISGATTATLTVSNVEAGDAGDYDVVVSNPADSVTSDPARLAVGVPTPGPLPSGAVAWWRAENNALDEIGGHHGTLKNGVGFTAGEVGQAFSLDGVDDFIRVSATSGLPVGNAPRTVELWFRPGTDFTPSTDSALIQYGTTADTRMFGLLVWSGVPGRLRFYGYNNDFSGVTVLEPNQWYHGAVTYDGTTVTLYLNGEYEGSRAANLDTLIDRNGLTIGYRPESGWRWKGLLDEVTIYNRALTAEEVQAIYRAQSGGKFVNPEPHILTQPESQTVPPGGNATFRVGASGTEPLSYQWRFNGSDLADGGRISGATTATLTVSNVEAGDAGEYDVVVSNPAGMGTSDPASLTVGVPAAGPLPSGAVAWWRAGNNALDEIGGHHGTLRGGASFAAGQVGQAFSLDGANGFVQVFTTTGLPVGNAPRTVELWFRTANDFTTSTDSALIQYGTAADNRMFGLITWSAAPGRLRFYGYNNDFSGVTVLEPNQWYHGAVTYDGTTVTLYLNGEYEVSKAATLDTLIDGTGLAIGCRTDNSGWRWKGLLDEVTMYNRGLTAEEVQSIYRSQSGGKLAAAVALSVVVEPENQIVFVGELAVFGVTAAGTPPLSYQWRKDRMDLLGQTGPTLTLNSVQISEAGAYDVVVRNNAGTATSRTATLTVRTSSPPQPGQGCSRTYTSDTDFDWGVLLNLNHSAQADQLQLNQETKPFPYIWVACSGRGTIVRVDVNTGATLGEYRTAPVSRGLNPSRTTVDAYGNVWVANRDENSSLDGIYGYGSVVKVGLVVGGTRGTKNPDDTFTPDSHGQYLKPPFLYSTALDRDGDGLIKTSIGLGSILDWAENGDGSVHSNPGGPARVADAEDECILIYQRLRDAPNPRHVSVDRDNNVWVGGFSYSPTMFHKLDGNDGHILDSFDARQFGAGGYGGFIDGNGILWSASLYQGLLRYDIAHRTGMQIALGLSYGLGIDSHGFVWNAQWTDNQIAKISPDGTVVFDQPLNPNGDCSRGVAVTADDSVWVANTCSGTVSRLANDGSLLKTIWVGREPTGVAVDANGKVWVTNLRSDDLCRIDPNGGADGLGALDLAVYLGPGAQPYNYSDMTGNVLLGIIQQGTWTVVHDSGAPGTAWGTVNWTSNRPSGTSVLVTVRAADNQTGLTSKPFQQVQDNVSFCGVGIVGQYLQVQVTFAREPNVQATPVLYDLTVRCCNQPPTADAGDDVSILTRQQSSTTLVGLASDPDGNALTYRWLEGTTEFLGSTPVNADETCPLNLGMLAPLAVGTHTLALEVNDGQVTASDSMLLTVVNSPPTLACVVGLSVEACAPVVLNGTVADFDGDTLSWTWMEGQVVHGSGSAAPPAGGAPTPLIPVTLAAGLPIGLHTFTFTATDSAGNTATCTTMLSVADTTPPLITACAPSQRADADAACQAVVPDFTSLVVASDCSGPLTITQTPSAGTLVGWGQHAIELTLADPVGNRSACSTSFTVEDTTAPSIESLVAPLAPLVVNALVQVTADFTDNCGPHTAVWDWGDSTSSGGVVTEANRSGTVTGEHVYGSAGVYRLGLTLTDPAGNSSSAAFEFIVIYDPNGGFVTGGGWINSPLGAYAPDPSLTGKATFGFVSKYQKGATVPTGNTQFKFHAAGMDFRSTSYQWLVIAGAKAQYKGSGTINGSGDYGFLLTAIDGQVNGGGGIDKFRIKIWDKASGGRVYDNQMNAPDDADPTTAIQGGSIVIHKEK